MLRGQEGSCSGIFALFICQPILKQYIRLPQCMGIVYILNSYNCCISECYIYSKPVNIATLLFFFILLIGLKAKREYNSCFEKGENDNRAPDNTRGVENWFLTCPNVLKASNSCISWGVQAEFSLFCDTVYFNNLQFRNHKKEGRGISAFLRPNCFSASSEQLLYLPD